MICSAQSELRGKVIFRKLVKPITYILYQKCAQLTTIHLIYNSHLHANIRECVTSSPPLYVTHSPACSPLRGFRHNQYSIDHSILEESHTQCLLSYLHPPVRCHGD